MPKNAFLHKKSLLDTFRDDYKVTNPIKAARAERTWDNPIVRHKREREINKWAHSFAGKRHIRKLTRFNATHEELMNEANRLRYPLEDVAKVANDALRTFRTRMWRVDVYNRFLADGTEIGAAVATDIAHRNFPYRWEFRGDLVARLMKGDEIIEEFHANDLDDLHEFLLDEGEITFNEGKKMKIKVRESKKNEKDEPTYVWFGLEHDEDGDYTDSLAVFVDDVSNGMVTVYAHMGQHSSASLDYVAGLEADPNPKGDLYKELIGQGYDNLVVVNTDVAEDMLGIRMHPDDDARELEDPEKYDMYEAREVKTAWTYLGELGKLEGDDSRKDAQSKLLKALGFTQGTEGRWYDGEGDLIDIIDELDNAEWDFAVKTCGPLQESKKDEGRAQCDLCGADMDEDDYDMHGGKCRGCRGPEKEPKGKWIVFLDGKEQGSYKTEPEARDAYKACVGKGDCYYTFKPSGKSEAYYKGKDRGFLVLVQKLIADNWYASARKEYPGLTLDCFEMNGDGDDMKICFEAYGEEIDDPMSDSLAEIAAEAAKKGCSDANRSTNPSIADYGLSADYIIWDEPEAFDDQWNYVINLSSKPKGKKGESADEKLGYEKGHKNSKGEPAPWVIRSHKDNSVLASFANKDDAYAHLQRMKQYSKSEARPTRQASQIKELCDMCRKDKQVADAVFKALTKDYNTSLDPVLAGQYLTKSWQAKLEELGGCNGWYDGFKKLYADMGVDFICSVLQDLKLGSSEIGCGACTSIVQDIYSRLAKKAETAKDGERAVDDYDTLRDGLKELGFELDSDIRNGKVYVYRSRFKATKDGVIYQFTINEDGEYTKSIEVFVGDEKPTRYKTVDDVLTAFKGTSESFHKVQVKDTLFDILKKHGVNDKAKVSYDGDAIVCEYDGTTLRIDNDLALTAKMQDKTIDRKYGTLADLSADLDKYFTKYVKEALEKNGVIVVPEWLWVAYETGDSSNLSVEEEQILDGFKAMAAGKVFDAEAEPSFRAFNDFDDYAGNCYEVQVYTIKENK